MSGDVVRLNDFCVKLTNKLKVTEKRTIISQVNEIVQRKEVRHRINNATKTRDSEEDSFDDSPKLTWISLHKVLVGVLNTEVCAFKNALSKQLKTTPELESLSCFKKVSIHGLHCENGLNANNVCNVLFTFLDDDNLVSKHYNDINQIVVQGILNEIGFNSISQECFEKLLDVFIEILKNSSPKSDNCSNVIKHLIVRGATRFDLKYRSICDDITGLMQNATREKPTHFWLNLIVSLNVLIKTYGFNDRRFFCTIGDKIADKIMPCLNQSGDIVEFFTHQMVFHHPKFTTTFPLNDSLINTDWKESVKGLYFFIYADIGSALVSKNSPEKCEAVAKLFIRAAFQVFCWGEEIQATSHLNSTFSKKRISDKSFVGEGFSSQRKRICIEIGWVPLFQHIESLIKSFSQSILSWLYVLKILVRDFLSCLESEDVGMMMKLVLKLLNSCKKQEVLKVVADVARLLVERTKCSNYFQSYIEIYRSLYECASRMIFTKNVQNEIFGLFSSLIPLGIVDWRRVQNDLCLVFTSSVSAPSTSACVYFNSFFLNCEFSDRDCNFPSFVESSEKSNSYKFRTFLLEWLLMKRTFCDDRDSQSSYGVFSTLDPSVLAKNIRQVCLTKPFSSNFESIETKRDENDMEKFFEEIQFTAKKLDNGLEENEQNSRYNSNKVVPFLCDLVFSNVMQIFEDVVQEIDSVDVKVLNSALSFGIFLCSWLEKCQQIRDDEYRKMSEVLEIIVTTLLQRTSCPKLQLDLVAKLLRIVQFSEKAELDMKLFTSLFALLSNILITAKFENGSSSGVQDSDVQQDSSGDVSIEETSDKSDFNILESEKLRSISMELLTHLSGYRFDCSAKKEAEKILLTVVETFESNDDWFFSDKAFFVDLICNTSSFLFERECSSLVAAKILSIFKLILDNEHKNDKCCCMVLRSCERLPNNACFDSVDVRERFLRMLTGFITINRSLRLPVSVKTCFVRCLINVQRKLLYAKIASNENNNTLDISSVLVEFASGDCRVFREIAKNFFLLCSSKSDFCTTVGLIFDNMLKISSSDTKLMCAVAGLIELMKIEPKFAPDCLWLICSVCRTHPLLKNIISRAFSMNFGENQRTEILTSCVSYCIRQWIRCFGENFETFPYELWKYENVLAFINGEIKHFIFAYLTTMDDRLKLTIEKATKTNVSQLIAKYDLDTVLNFLLNREPTTSTKLNVKYILEQNLEEFFYRMLGRFDLQNEFVSLSLVIGEILKILNVDSFSTILKRSNKESFYEMLFLLRASVGSKVFSVLRFKRFLDFLSLIQLGELGNNWATMVCREFVVNVLFIVKSGFELDSESFNSMMKVLKTWLLEIPMNFVDVASNILIPCARTLQALHVNAPQWNSLSHFLLFSLPTSEIDKMPLLPDIGSFSANRQNQLLNSSSIPLTEFVDKFLEVPLQRLSVDDLTLLLTRLESNLEELLAVSTFKWIKLMNVFRCICENEAVRWTELAPPVVKIVGILNRLKVSGNKIPSIYNVSLTTSFCQIVESINNEINNEDVFIARAALVSFRKFLAGRTSSGAAEMNLSIPVLSLIKTFEEKNIKREKFETFGTLANAWFFRNMDTKFSFDDWILKMINDLVGSTHFCLSLKELCSKSVSFCAKVFPCILEIIFVEGSKEIRDNVVDNLTTFLSNLLKNTKSNVVSLSDCERTVCLFLQAFYRLRVFAQNDITFRLFNIDYFVLGELCSLCGFYFETTFFLELGSEKIRSKKLNHEVHFERYKKNIVSDFDGQASIILQNSFVKLNNVDATYGLSDSFIALSNVRSFLWMADREWSKAVAFYSTLDHFNDEQFLNMASFALGLGNCFGASNWNEEQLSRYRFDCAHRLGSWNSVESAKRHPTSFGQLVYESISTAGDLELINYYSDIGSKLLLGDMKTFPDFVANACLLDEISKLPFFSNVKSNWMRESLKVPQFTSHVEEVFCSFRWGLLLKHLNSMMKEDLAEHLCGFFSLTERRIDWYRRELMPAVAMHIINECKQVATTHSKHLSVEMLYAPVFKEIETLWDSNENLLALSKLKALKLEMETIFSKNRGTPSQNVSLLAKALVLLGQYQTKLDSPSLANECFEKATLLLESLPIACQSNVAKTVCEAYASMARYTDENYQNLTDYINSSNFDSKKSVITRFRQSVAVSDAVRQGRTYLTMADKKSNLDQKEVDEIIEAQANLLQATVSFYLRCLVYSTENDLKIFRVISLWFDNLNAPALANSFVDFAEKIPTRKWLLVWTQLTSRLSLTIEKCDPFAQTIYDIILKTSLDHPYHTFFTLFSLLTSANTNNDDLIKQKRSKAAQKMIAELKMSHRAGVYSDLEELAKGYLEVGRIDTLKLNKKEKRNKFPPRCKLPTYARSVPVVTLALNVDNSYDRFVSIIGFENFFSIASGKSAPAILYCKCSDGVTRKQIVKGHDDTRQDAIMEQTFGIVNLLLNKKTSDNRENVVSRMRTYNVIPLSPDCGVIEWCEGCVSIGDYLVGLDLASGAHKKYYPSDWSALTCRGKVADVLKADFITKMNMFENVCNNIQPVFRHFFFERFKEPMVWYDARLVYARSVAVSSMVGHILGLSDRHTQNILVDETSAELVQIDLGMAFEQGRILPTPERVPFRLSRDVVDGMGVCGVEGVFRRHCERVMRVLRDSKDVLVPIVSVLLHDPVSEWVLTDQKIERAQPARGSSKKIVVDATKNEHAERAILKVIDKLKGMEKTSILTPVGQVAFLIDQARDPTNLSQMYCGWQAYL